MKGCELLLKILDAILSQPEEEKFRKIRTVCIISIDTQCMRPAADRGESQNVAGFDQTSSGRERITDGEHIACCCVTELVRGTRRLLEC